MKKTRFMIGTQEAMAILLLVVVFLGASLHLSFATDTYMVYMTGFRNAASDMLIRNGRPIIAAVYYLFGMLKLPNDVIYYISATLAIVFLYLSIILYDNILYKYIKNQNERIVISFISVANLYIIEYYMFLEKCCFMLAILFNVIAFGKIEKALEKGNKRYVLQAIVFVVLSAYTYQGVMPLYIVLGLPFIYKYSDSFKKYLSNLLVLVIPYAVSTVLVMAYFLITKSFRGEATETSLVSNIGHVLGAFYHFLYDSFGLTPKYLIGVVVFVLLGIQIFIVVQTKNEKYRLAHLIIMMIVASATSLATILQGSGWNAMRVVYPLASIIGMLVVDISMNDLRKTDTRNLRIVIMLCMLVMMSCQYKSFNKIFIDKNKNDIADQLRVEFIGSEIQKYESANEGVKVKKIAFYYDSKIKFPFYPGLYYNGDMVVSLFYTSWSNINGINYYLNSEYEKIDSSDEYARYFMEKNWDSLSVEQMVFDGDTLHLCMY